VSRVSHAEAISLFALAAFSGAGVLALARAELPLAGGLEQALLAASIAPWAFALLALASGRVRAELVARRRRAPLAGAALVLATFLLASAAAGKIDPYTLAIAATGAWAVLAALEAPGDERGDLLAWLALWVPLDLRWTRELWPHPKLSYDAIALVVATLAVAGFTLRGRDLGHRLPRPRDVAIGLGALVAFGAIAIPVGLATGFLASPHASESDPAKIVLLALGIALTVALPEEIFFRGLLDAGLRSAIGRPWLSLAISSAAFGLTHWNNAEGLRSKAIYCALATVAGVFYGLAYRRGGGLPAAVICHASVDAIWKVALTR
jgi:membrane protease YdiL (CAAX protease family)